MPIPFGEAMAMPLLAGGGGGAAAGGAAAGASLAALGPFMLGTAALQGGFQALGGVMEQKASDKAIEEFNKNKFRDLGIAAWLSDREQGREMAALREGYNFMLSPVAQQKADRDARTAFALAGKFDPYLFGMKDRFI